MGKLWRRSCVAALTAVVAALVVGAGAAPASAVGVAHEGLPTPTPSDRPPQILDNRVLDMEQVGGRIVVAGSFTQVRNAGGNGGATFDQPYVFAFDPVTGAIDQAFRPSVSGVVNAVLPGPGNTVYLGGTFTTVNGQAASNLAQVSLATGARTGFRAPAFNGAIYDLALSGGRLFVGGVFNTVGGVGHGGLATLNPATGALDGYMGIDVSLNHNYPDRGTARGSVGVVRVDITPDGSRLVAIGNFRQAEGLVRDQVVMVLLQPGGAVVDPNWRTTRYEAACNSRVFDYHVKDLQFAPDGSFFSITTTGGAYPGTLCDSVTRWETAATGQDVQPTWADFSGGDSLFSVEVTGSVVYAGGHQRWMNNPDAREAAGAGAVPRPGLSVHDARTGLPLAWNPGRHPRGIGAEAMLATATGLYVGSDTEYIGNREHFRPRLAYFPLAGGGSVAPETPVQLPANVHLAGRAEAAGDLGVDDVLARYFDGTTAGPDGEVPGGGIDWSRVRGAFMAGDVLFYGHPDADGSYFLHRVTFDGSRWGTGTPIDPYNDPTWSDVRTGSTSRLTGEPVLYRGALPAFYGQLPTVTGMFHADGRLYYTREGAQELFYRYFSVDSGIVGPQEFTAAPAGFGDVAGMFLSGDQVYFAARSTGELRRTAFSGGAPTGAADVVDPGPGAGGRDWRAHAMFPGPGDPPGGTNLAPTATFTADCVDLLCAFDGSGSSDPDGSVASWAWDFGDGITGTGPSPNHTYAAAGDYEVRLTVTDDGGAEARMTTTLSVESSPPGSGIGLRGSVGTSATASSVSVRVPEAVQAGDGLLLVLSTNSTVTGSAPAGWVQEASLTASGVNPTTQVFSRVAGAADAGSELTVPLSGLAKATLQLVAYSGTDRADAVASVTGAAAGAGTAHTTPTGTAGAASWVVSVWSDKQADARQWTPPAGVVERSNLAGNGNGDVATLVADSGAAVPSGPAGGLTATVPTPSNRATMFTVVLAPGAAAATPENQAPEAVFSSSCAELVCTFDGTGSTDPDGTVASYAWDFGDGGTGTGPTAEHTYAAAGDYEVTLTVTDDDGATDSVTATVPVTPPPPPGEGIGLRGSAGTAATATSLSITVPESAQAGDGLVLVLSTNSTVTGAAPAGWTQAASLTAFGLNPTTQVFQRVAGAGDAGSELTVPLSGLTKATLQLLAYSGTSTDAPIASVLGEGSPSGTAHTTPAATAGSGSWIVSVWSDKQAAARQWTPPAGVSERGNIAGVGNGDIATLVADSGAAVPSGPAGGLTATVPTPSNRAATFTVVLAPGAAAATPENQAPEAVFSSSCAELVCTFDGTGSTDPDGTVASYAWDFGDGGTGTGPTAEHTYAAAGDYEVTLTVTDEDGATGQVSSTVPVAAPPPPGTGISLRGSAGTAATATSLTVTVPESVQAGDGLLLVLSVNTTVTGTPPSGWAEQGTQVAGNITSQVFSRVAADGDGGSELTVTLGAAVKGTLQLLAYAGTDAAAPVATVTSAESPSGSAHTTPAATVAAEGSWVVSVWSDKQAAAREWTPPAGVSERGNIAGVGNGDIATLVADSGSPVPPGEVAGLTATVSNPSNRATTFTVVLAPAG